MGNKKDETCDQESFCWENKGREESKAQPVCNAVDNQQAPPIPLPPRNRIGLHVEIRGNMSNEYDSKRSSKAHGISPLYRCLERIGISHNGIALLDDPARSKLAIDPLPRHSR